MTINRAIWPLVFLAGCASGQYKEYRANLFQNSITTTDNFQDPVTGREYRVGYSFGKKYGGNQAREIWLRPLDKRWPTLVRGEDNDNNGFFETVLVQANDDEQIATEQIRSLLYRASDYMERQRSQTRVD